MSFELSEIVNSDEVNLQKFIAELMLSLDSSNFPLLGIQIDSFDMSYRKDCTSYQGNIDGLQCAYELDTDEKKYTYNSCYLICFFWKRICFKEGGI